MVVDETGHDEDLINNPRYRGLCGRFHVTTLSKIIAIVGIIVESIIFGLVLFAAIMFINEKDVSEKTTSIAASLAAGIVSIIVYLMVLYGLKKEKPWPFLPFILFKGAELAVIVIVTIVTVITMINGHTHIITIAVGIIVMLIYLAIKLWAWFIVKRTHSYFSEILLNKMYKNAQAEANQEQYQMNRY